MKKLIIPLIVFALAAVLFCGCKGKKGSGKASENNTEINNSSFVAKSSETGSVSDAQKENSTVTVYDEVNANGKAEDIDSPSAESSKTGSGKADSSAGSKESNETKPEENSSSENRPSDSKSDKDSMSGWSIWQ